MKQTKSNNIFKIIILILTFILLCNIVVYFYLKFSYDLKNKNQINYKYQHSIKSVDYLMPYSKNDVYYNESRKSVYLYNQKKDVVLDYFIEGVSKENFNILFYSNEPELKKVNENIYYLKQPKGCENIAISIFYKNSNEYSFKLIDDIKNFDLCSNNY